MAKATQPRKRFGTWLARAINTVYQAATDGIVCAWWDGTTMTLRGITDSVNPPTIIRQEDTPAQAVVGYGACIAMPVRKNDYWEATCLAAATVYWIPLEP